MNNQTFLELSLLVRKLPLSNISDLWAYRYSFFVQNSPRGHNCTYSRMCRERFVKDEYEHLEKKLLECCAPQHTEILEQARIKLGLLGLNDLAD